MKLLVVEDEPKASAYLAQGLTEAGFVVDTARDGEEGLRAARAADYDLIVCDVMLPHRDGFSLVGELRRAGRQTPVLLVTARSDVDARVRGLDLGADDYIVKPFAFAELLARVRAVLRRTPARAPDIYRVADLVIDLRTRRVERAGDRIDLTPREFSMLQFLLEHAGEVVSRTVIADRVWGMNFDSDTNVIDVQVRRLRSKLEPDGTVPTVEHASLQSYSRISNEGIPQGAAERRRPAPGKPDGQPARIARRQTAAVRPEAMRSRLATKGGTLRLTPHTRDRTRLAPGELLHLPPPCTKGGPNAANGAWDGTRALRARAVRTTRLCPSLCLGW